MMSVNNNDNGRQHFQEPKLMLWIEPDRFGFLEGHADIIE